MDDRASPHSHSPLDRDAPPTAMMMDQSDTTAHSLLHWIQCIQCLRPLRAPVRLPCGNTLCRSCLPPVQPRVGITYPAGEGRKNGFICPWGSWRSKGDMCVGEHCLGDCGVDVLLTRLVEVFDEVLTMDGEEGEGLKSKDSSRQKTLDGLKDAYQFMKKGRFHGASPVESKSADLVLTLKEAIRNELDCQVCYSLILDPLTTPCGHTFCLKCVTLVLNHSDLCPVCRRKMNMPSSVQSEPMNKHIAGLMESLIPDQVVAQRETLAEEGADPSNQRTIPLFVSSVCFPTMPTFLHIFEPRYRIMIRRVMENREHKFGIIAYNRARRRQGGLGRTQFMQYGTLLLVDRFELLPDGRSLVIATGVSRFKVIKSDMVDGYHVGQVERLDDVPIIDEERYEVAETAVSVGTLTADQPRRERPLDSMPTQQLFDLTMDFVRKEHREGAPWLHPRALMAYGNEPTDPSRFPWWFASILNVSEEDKYALLCATSVRERLKISARWARKLETKEWSTRPAVLSVL